MSETQDLTREDLIIREFFDDPMVKNKISSHLEKDLFDNPDNKRICDFIIRFNKKYKIYPSAQELITALPENTRERNKLLFLMNAKIKTMSSDFIISMIESFFREKKTEQVLTTAAECIHDGKVDHISDLVHDLAQAVNFSLHLDMGLHVVDDTEEALRRLNAVNGVIPSPLNNIRCYTDPMNNQGGFYRKALTVYYGMTGVGKTIMLCNDAAYAYQSGFNVLYITMEMSEELIWERIASNVTHIKMGEIRKKNPEEIKKLLVNNKLKSTNKVGNIFVKSLLTTDNVTNIENEIIELKQTKGINIDLLVVDYIGIMKPAHQSFYRKDSTTYLIIKEAAEQLRDLAKRYDLSTVTASQVDKQGYNVKDVEMQNVAGSVGLNDTADLVISITQDPLLKQCGLYFHMILKNRFGPAKVNFLSTVDYSYMRVLDASDDDRDKYTELQLNQTQSMPDFKAQTFDMLKKNMEVEKNDKDNILNDSKNISLNNKVSLNVL